MVLLVPNASSPSWLCGDDVNKTGEYVAFLMQNIKETEGFGYMQFGDRTIS